MSTSDVSRNYSRTGSELIEKIYSDDYLSIGGKASTDSLARDASIMAETKVLDAGDGRADRPCIWRRALAVGSWDWISLKVTCERRRSGPGRDHWIIWWIFALAMPWPCRSRMGNSMLSSDKTLGATYPTRTS